MKKPFDLNAPYQPAAFKFSAKYAKEGEGGDCAVSEGTTAIGGDAFT